jgi:hypothetical protein
LKQILFFFLFILNGFFGFSQSEKLIRGKVLSGETPLSNIDIVNMNSKKSVTTDSFGNFNILAKTGDELFIISKEYVDKKTVLTQEQANQNNILIYLEKKPVVLDDVTITTMPSIKFKLTQSDIDAGKLSKQAKALKVQNVYDGTIENGVDFIRLFKGLINLFKNKDKEEIKKNIPLPSFKDYLNSHYDRHFYLNNLKLKPEEIDLFIAYCEADHRAKSLAERQDLLEMADFLFEKNEEFKKLER